MLPDPLGMVPSARHAVAEAARLAYDIELPELEGWNSAPCEAHAEHGYSALEPGCHDCGIIPRRAQRTGASWLFFQPRALLADSTGLGKTVQAALLLALCREAGTLSPGSRALVICRAPTIGQWRSQLARMVPGIPVITLDGDRRARARALLSPAWEVALCGPEMIAGKASRAAEQLDGMGVTTVIIDDVDVVRNLSKTSRVIRELCEPAARVVVCTATPLDKRLTQLYDLGAGLLGWGPLLGSREEFQHRFVRREQVWYTPKLKPTRCRYCKCFLLADHARRTWTPGKLEPHAPVPPCPVQSGKAGKAVPHFPLSRTEPGAKYQWSERGPEPLRLEEFRARIAPYVLRRTAADAEDADMPGAQVSQVWLDLGKEQAQRYEEVRRGVLVRLGAGGKVTRQEAENLWMRAWQVTSGLANLDTASSAESVKLDKAVEMLTGDLADEPVVVYAYFRKTLEDLAGRLRREKVTAARIWGDQRQADTDAALAAFNGGQARVMMITDAGGMGLNLQRARRLILVDTPRSAGRMAQLVGRCRRDGSAHATVYVTQLLTTTPLEASLAGMVGREAVMQAAVMDEGRLGEEFAWAQEEPEALLRAVTG